MFKRQILQGVFGILAVTVGFSATSQASALPKPSSVFQKNSIIDQKLQTEIISAVYQDCPGYVSHLGLAEIHSSPVIAWNYDSNYPTELMYNLTRLKSWYYADEYHPTSVIIEVTSKDGKVLDIYANGRDCNPL